MKLNIANIAVMAIGLFTPAAAEATTYTPGQYQISSYVMSATGSTCFLPAKTYLSSIYTYPGPNKPGAVARDFLNGPKGYAVYLLNFPTTAPAGATSTSGPITETILPGGTPVTGTFSSDFTVTDSRSYVAKTTYVVGGCTSVVQEVGVWITK